LKEVTVERERIGIGDLYHRETRYRRDTISHEGLDWDHQPSPYKEISAPLKRIALPSPKRSGGRGLWETVAIRRSARNFSKEAMMVGELSQLIWATQGITSTTMGYDFRACPSAGALYPIETYLLANRVEGLSPGIYHYSVKGTQLVLVKEGNFGSALSDAGLGQEMLEEAAVVFIWTAMVERSKWKYRERAYRYIYMDAGHIGQNFYLAATGLGLGCCTVAAFFDREVEQLIGVDGSSEIVLYLGAVGRIA
jgi:SagB-type dehydrogenase family enzyme